MTDFEAMNYLKSLGFAGPIDIEPLANLLSKKEFEALERGKAFALANGYAHETVNSRIFFPVNCVR